ncbi:MAG: transcription antitermination factor NusB [Bacilli bacterium]|nr:transcription antitermination factor NusB [Bacilli bacterium]
MKNRSELRDIIIKVLYQINIYEEAKIDYNKEDIIKELLEVENSFVNETVSGIIKNNKKIESIANEYLKDWTIDRLSKVDQAILKLGIYELLYTETPSIVAINEAIELSKKYSEEKVTKMINGVLDKIYHEKEK